MIKHIREKELVAKIGEVFRGGPYPLADYPGTGGSGGAGVVLENLLGMVANNISAADAVEFELKTAMGDNLLTLFHKEPENQDKNAVGAMTPVFGWSPTKKSSADETVSFRHTVRAAVSDRGFRVVVRSKVVQVAFDPAYVTPNHADWLENVRRRRGGELDGESVWLEWTRDELSRVMSHKMPNCILVHGTLTGKKIGGRDGRIVNFHKMEVFKELLLSRLYRGLKRGVVAVDIDTELRPGEAIRNHGTKLRIRKGALATLYRSVSVYP